MSSEIASPSCARPQGVEACVRACMELMAAGRWVRGETGPELAAQWGVTVAAVEKWASEASRRVKRASDPAWVRDRVCVALSDALDQAQTIAELRDRVRAVVEVAKAWAPIAGAVAPQRHELTGAGGGPVQLTAVPGVSRELAERAEAGDIDAIDDVRRKAVLDELASLPDAIRMRAVAEALQALPEAQRASVLGAVANDNAGLVLADDS